MAIGSVAITLRGLRELRGRLELAGGVDDLRALLAFGFGLPRHRALHVRRQIDVLHFDGRHLDAPRIRALIQDLLQVLVEPFALRQQVVELDLAEHAPQRGLGQLRRRVDVVLDFHDRPARIHDAEIEHRVHLDRDVVSRDDVLRRDIEHHRPQADPHDAIDRCEHEDDAGPFGLGQELAEPENDAALVFGQDLDRADQIGADDESTISTGDMSSSQPHSLRTVRIKPLTPVTRTRIPSANRLGRRGLPVFTVNEHPAQASRFDSRQGPAGLVDHTRPAGHGRLTLGREAEPHQCDADRRESEHDGHNQPQAHRSSGEGESMSIIEPNTRLTRPPPVSNP